MKDNAAAIVRAGRSATNMVTGATNGSNITPNIWRPPDNEWLKVNVDVGFHSNGMVGLGAIIRDANGCVVSAVVERLNTSWAVVVTEL